MHLINTLLHIDLFQESSCLLYFDYSSLQKCHDHASGIWGAESWGPD